MFPLQKLLYAKDKIKKKMRLLKYKIYLLLLVLIFTLPCYSQENSSCIKINQNLFNDFSFQDMVEMSNVKNPTGDLGKRIDFALNNPIVDSTINCNSNQQLPENPKIGKYIRLASWNIERGFKLDNIKLIFTNPDQLLSLVKKQTPKEIEKVKNQADILKKANIIVLTEVDNGMPRTGYRNVAQELAKTINYNYAYGIEYFEVDPVHLGLEDYKWSEERGLLKTGIMKNLQIDQNLYKGEHGSAILSQFPIISAKVIRLPEYYDWFSSEKSRISQLEDMKRNAAEFLFNEDMFREVRHGSRIALLANIQVPGFDMPVTVVALHLENRTIPAHRAEQIKYLLKNIYNIDNPVILAGDFNTTTSDGSPTSIVKEVKKKIEDPNFVAKTVLLYAFVPQAFIVNSFVDITGFTRKMSDPTVANIPVIFPNPEKELFDVIHHFRFEDGHYFDFRGQKNRSSGFSGTLSDSNEKSIKGFVPSFLFDKSWFVGKFKLDWFFVKAYLKNPNDKRGSTLMAPYYGRTLFDLNYSMQEPFSDHAPITVDLPIQEIPSNRL